MRGRSYSPSPPRGYGRRGRSPSPRGRYGGRGRDLPTSLLVRNLRRDCRAEDLRRPFGQFGPLKDIYLPRDYHTGLLSSTVILEFEDTSQVLRVILKRMEPRGFGFVQYVDPADAAEAKYHMDGQIILGREVTVVFAEENRKKPLEMRARERRGRTYDYRRSPRRSRSPRYHRSRSPRYSRSPRRGRSRSRSHSYDPPPKQRQYSRSVSPQDRPHRERSYTLSPQGRPKRERSYSESPVGSRSRSRGPEENPDEPVNRERSLSASQ